MRKVIRLNDPTTHGGKVITASPNSKPLKAPKLVDDGFLPQAYHLGTRDDRFDGGRDAPGFSRNTARQRTRPTIRRY